jgi:GntR family transcriptional regulator/MocR family aminotransferase
VPGADFLHLDAADARRGGLTAWLTAEIRSAIADGRLSIGSRLPATRVLAGELGVSRGVVVQAYAQLVDEGRATTRHGGGTIVATAPPQPPPVESPGQHQRPGFDLSPGRPDLSAFPRSAWLQAERAVLVSASAADLGYGDPAGAQPLRQELASWLARTRGVRAGPQDIIVVAGVAQALALLARVLTDRGLRCVATEDPGSRGTREQVARWGLVPVPVPVDEHGLDVTALESSGTRAVLVTPAHQFPTGVVLAPQRRRAQLDWAAGGGLVIEDDYDAEHRYDRPPVAALHGLAPQWVAYTGSTSKTLAPALRLGWLIPPAHLREDVLAAKSDTDLGNPTIPQLVFARLLASGALERHLRRTRIRQRARRDATVAALRAYLPAARVHGVAAGLHLLVTLPDGVDDEALAARARHDGVIVQPLSAHRQSDGPPGLVLGYAAQSPDRIREAVRQLATSYRGECATPKCGDRPTSWAW